MKMIFKKEVKHSVVYEAEQLAGFQPPAALKSVYVGKEWLRAHSTAQKFPPESITLEVTAP